MDLITIIISVCISVPVSCLVSIKVVNNKIKNTSTKSISGIITGNKNSGNGTFISQK